MAEYLPLYCLKSLVVIGTKFSGTRAFTFLTADVAVLELAPGVALAATALAVSASHDSLGRLLAKLEGVF